MLYGGMLGLSICRGIQNVSMERVQQAYRDLSQLNRMLRQCIQDITKAENVVQYHAQANQLFVQLRPTWRDNILMPTEETAPMAAQIPIYDLPISKKTDELYIRNVTKHHPTRHFGLSWNYCRSFKLNGSIIPLVIYQWIRALFTSQ